MERGTLLGRLNWQLGEVINTQVETARTKSIQLAVPTWLGHRPGQHVDVRLTAEDGYQVERSYSIASPPEEHHRVTLTVERLDDGEVSPYLTEELRVGDGLELRGPIGGYARLGCSDGWTAPAGRRGIGHCATHGYAPSPGRRGQHRSSSLALFVAFL